MRRVAQFHSGSKDLAISKAQVALEECEPDMPLADDKCIAAWDSDTRSAYNELKRLTTIHGAGGMLMPEALLARGLRKRAPTRHRQADHWATTKTAVTLVGFFEPMMSYENDRVEAGTMDTSGRVYAAIAKLSSKLPGEKQAVIAAALSPGGGDGTTSAVESEAPGKNGATPFGRVIRCSNCRHIPGCEEPSKGHHRPGCPHPPTTKRPRNAGKDSDGTGKSRGALNNVCPFVFTERGCKFGDRCSMLHPGDKSAGANTAQAGPPPGYPPPAGAPPPPTETPMQQEATASSARGNSRMGWVWGPLCIMAMCTMAAAAGPIRGPAHSKLFSMDRSADAMATIPGLAPQPRYEAGGTSGGYWYLGRRGERQRVGTGAYHAATGAVYGPATANAANVFPWEADKSEWLWDSGANVNVTKDRERLTQYRGTKHIQPVRDASGKQHRVHGWGEAMIESSDHTGQRCIIRIERALHIPTFAVNIVSEAAMRRSGLGYTAPPLPSRTEVYGPDRRKVRLQGHNGLHYLVGGVARSVTAPVLNPPRVREPTAARGTRKRACTTLLTAPTWTDFQRRLNETTGTAQLLDTLDGEDEGFSEGAAPTLNAAQRMAVRIRLAGLSTLTVGDPATSPFFILHHQLGHRNMTEAAKYAVEAGIKLPKIEHRWCEACLRAKAQRRAQHRVILDRSHLQPFEKVFCDVAGPFPTPSAHNGYRYVLGFICAKTHTLKVMPMHTLREAQGCTRRFLRWVRQHRGEGFSVDLARNGVWCPIGQSVLQTDCAAYFRSNDFIDLVHTEFGCRLQHSPPYDQSRSGVIERAWKTINQSATAMRNANDLGPEYWWWAWRHAAEVHDVIGTSANEKGASPYEARLGHKPKRVMHSFGAKVTIWNAAGYTKGTNPGIVGRWVGFNTTNNSHMVRVLPHNGKRASYRETPRVSFHGETLPEPIMRGAFGLKNPGYRPLHRADDEGGHVDIEADPVVDEVTRPRTAAPGRDNTVQAQSTTTTPQHDTTSILRNTASSEGRDRDMDHSGTESPTMVDISEDEMGPDQPNVEMPMEETLPTPAPTARRSKRSTFGKREHVRFRDEVESAQPKQKRRSHDTQDVQDEPDMDVLDLDAEGSGMMGCFAIGEMIFDVRKAINHKEYGEGFREAIKAEQDGIKEFDVMEKRYASEVPNGTKVFNSFMICMRKALGAGSWKHKGRWVCDGRGVIPGTHTVEENFATAFPPWMTVRSLIALACGDNWHVRAGDIKQAFLKGESGVPIWMRAPRGLEEYEVNPATGRKEQIVYLVTGNLYGKADAPRRFERALVKWALARGFMRSEVDPCLWVRGLGTKNEIRFVIFCDDIIMSAPNTSTLDQFDKELADRWGDCKCGVPKYLLGCDFTQDKGHVHLPVATKVDALLAQLKMESCRTKDTPLAPGTTINASDKPEVPIKMPFRSVLGQVSYMMLSCRPDLAFACSQLARVQGHPTKEHWKMLMHVVRYLRKTRDHGVSYGPGDHDRNVLCAYADASWADIPGSLTAPDARKSTLGHVLFLNGGPIEWRSKVSTMMALSSAESEIFATVQCAKSIAHCRRLLYVMGRPQDPTATVLHGDSTSAISFNSSRTTASRLRHLELKWLYCRQLVQEGLIQLKWSDTNHMLADPLTKALPVFKHKFFLPSLARSLAGLAMQVLTRPWW